VIFAPGGLMGLVGPRRRERAELVSRA